jgi:hypothetical protein
LQRLQQPDDTIDGTFEIGERLRVRSNRMT